MGFGRGVVVAATISAYAQRDGEEHDLGPDRERGVAESRSAQLDLRRVGRVEGLQPVGELPMNLVAVIDVLVERLVDLRAVDGED